MRVRARPWGEAGLDSDQDSRDPALCVPVPLWAVAILYDELREGGAYVSLYYDPEDPERWDEEGALEVLRGILDNRGLEQVGTNGNPLCPRCGAPTEKKTNRSTGHAFLGCVDYPDCRWTRSLRRT